MLLLVLFRQASKPDLITLQIALIFHFSLHVSAAASDNKEHVNHEIREYTADENETQPVQLNQGPALCSKVDNDVNSDHIEHLVHEL